MKSLFSTALMLFIFSVSAHGKDFFVDNAIGASGDGQSWNSAWKNFSDVSWSALRPGDTLYISGGSTAKTYYQSLNVQLSGASGASINIRPGLASPHNGQVIIDGQSSRTIGVTVESKNYVTISQLNIRNHTDCGIRVRYATAGVLIEGNSIYTGAGRGLDARGNNGTSAAVFRSNIISTPSSTTGQNDGIWSSDNNGVVYEQNRIVISNNDTTGHSDGIQSYLDYNITIRGNFIHQANSASADNHGMWLSDTRNGGTIKVYNNAVYVPNLTQDSAITHWAESTWNENGTIRIWNNTIIGGRRSLNLDKTPNAQAFNNILWPSVGGYGYYIVNGTIPTANINNNLVWAPSAYVAYANGATRTWSGWQSLGYDSNGAYADPQVLDLSTGNFHLKSTSPAIDRGVALLEVTSDLEGVARPQGVASDIGAFEYVGSGSSDTVAPTIPTGLNASIISSTQVNLSWIASTDNVAVTGYQVFRNGIQIATATGPSYANTGLLANTTYSYAIRAFDAANNVSGLSTTVSVTTLAPAPTVQTYTFYPTDDSFVDASRPTRNYGSNSSIKADGSPLQIAYTKFAVTGITGTIKSVTLRLYAMGGTSDGPGYYLSSTNWSELTLNYQNRPTLISSRLGKSGSFNSGVWLSLDVLSVVSANGVYSFAATMTSSDGVAFSSKEGSRRAELIVTVSAGQ